MSCFGISADGRLAASGVRKGLHIVELDSPNTVLKTLQHTSKSGQTSKWGVAACRCHTMPPLQASEFGGVQRGEHTDSNGGIILLFT